MVRVLSLLLLLTGAVAVAVGEPPLRATPLDAAGAAARWAGQLGDRDYHTRERASRELDALGEAAMPALDRVIATGTPEAVGRAQNLAARIAARAENARAIAPKVVDIDRTDEPYGTILAEFQKQTGYQIRINGNQAVLGKKGDFTAKKEPFWVALERFTALTGLEVESAAGLNAPVNVSRDLLAEQAQMRLQVERDRLQARLAQAKVAKEVLQKQEAAAMQALARLTDELRKEKGPVVEKAIADVRKMLEANAAEIADLEKQFAAATALPPLAGTIVLRAAGPTKMPATVAGAVRIHATPFPGQAAQVSSEVLPLLLTATPEPSLRWVRTTEVIITNATTPDGRRIGFDPTAAIPSVDASRQQEELMLGFRGGRRGLRRGGYYVEPTRQDVLGGYSPTAFQTIIRLNTPRGAAVSKLATVEGLMRAKVWTQPEAVATIKALSGEDTRVFGPNGVSLQAKLSPDPNDTSAHYLDVELVYDTTEVSPQTKSSGTDPLYLEQLPGGGVRAVRPRTRPTTRGNPQGLSVTDRAGNEFNLSLRMAETTSLSYDPFTGSNRLIKLKQQYIVRAAKSDTGAPARLAFTAIRLREVDLPFKLTDVPVAAGTMDPNSVPVAPAYPVYDR